MNTNDYKALIAANNVGLIDLEPILQQMDRILTDPLSELPRRATENGYKITNGLSIIEGLHIPLKQYAGKIRGNKKWRTN